VRRKRLSPEFRFASAGQGGAKMVLFRNLNLVDGVSGEVQEGMAVRVEGERIVGITRDREGLQAGQVSFGNP
jgi:hypothetical protein